MEIDVQTVDVVFVIRMNNVFLLYLDELIVTERNGGHLQATTVYGALRGEPMLFVDLVHTRIKFHMQLKGKDLVTNI